MNTPSLEVRVEAILYLKGRPVDLIELSELAHAQPKDVKKSLKTLVEIYEKRDSALEIIDVDGNYCLQLRQCVSELVKNLLPVNLSTATLRTLATIALKKRILQSELVEIRGSGVYEHIKELLANDFVERRRQADGRSFWITLSEKFHRTFSLLPNLIDSDLSKAA